MTSARLRSAMLALVAALAAGAAQAQVVHTRPASSAGGAGSSGSAGAAPARIGVIAAPPPVVYVPGNQSFFVPPGMVLYGSLPIVVLPDGRVYADFGRGYEQIIRSCAAVVNYSVITANPVVQPTVVQPTVVQPPVTPQQQLPYTPPVPNQVTPSQQMLQQGNAQMLASQSTLVNNQTCWTGNGYGQVYIAHP